MKTLNFRNSTKLVLGTIAAFLVACDKKSDSSPTPVPAVPAVAYRWDGVTCRDVNGSPVAQNLCNTATTTGLYRMVGTQCLDNNNNPVAMTLCQTNGVNGNYRWNGYQCVDYNGLAVAQQLCQSSLANGYQILNGSCYTNQGSWVTYSYCTGVSGYVAGQCNGTYVMYHTGFFQTIECQGTNCKGLTLQEYYSGRQVVCP